MSGANLIPRQAASIIFDWLQRPEAIVIKGPRQAGKTTLLSIVKQHLMKQGHPSSTITIINFEKRDLLRQFQADPLEFVTSCFSDEGLMGREADSREEIFKEERVEHRQRHFLFLDEYQYVKNGGQRLKLIFDELTPQVKLVVTGSSSLQLTQNLAKYMVGRMLSLHLFPLSFGEFLQARDTRLAKVRNAMRSDLGLKPVSLSLKQTLPTKQGQESAVSQDQSRGQNSRTLVDLTAAWSDQKFKQRLQAYQTALLKLWHEYVVYGGYPAVVLAKTPKTKRALLRSLVQTYVERDIISLLQVESVDEFRVLVRLLAAQTGQLLNYNSLGTDAGLHYKKLKHFLSILQETYVIKLLKPYHKNLSTELTKMPKAYFLDPGLRNLLVNNFAQVDFRQDKGALLESTLLGNLFYVSVDRPEIDLHYWRTSGGAEMDFVQTHLNQGETQLEPFEVKYRNLTSCKMSKAMHSFVKHYQPPWLMVLTQNFLGVRSVRQTQVLFLPAYLAAV